MASESALELDVHVASLTGARRLELALALPAGVTVLFGPSGAGKSTCLSTLAGLVRPTRGRIVLRGRTLFDSTRAVEVPTHARRVALVFQTLALFPHLSVLENVAFGVPRQVVGAERRALSTSWLERMQVGQLATRRPDTLSGGEAQRVALARALASAPQLLLLDEPFSALDRILRREIAQEVANVVSELGIPALLVTHDSQDAAQLGDRVVRLRDGRLDDRDACEQT